MLSPIEFEFVAALAFGCALFYAIGKKKFHPFGLVEFVGFLLVFGIFFWPVLVGWWVVRTLILAVS